MGGDPLSNIASPPRLEEKKERKEIMPYHTGKGSHSKGMKKKKKNKRMKMKKKK